MDGNEEDHLNFFMLEVEKMGLEIDISEVVIWEEEDITKEVATIDGIRKERGPTPVICSTYDLIN